MTEIGEVSWTGALEEYFASTGERAHCLGWAHKQAEEIYGLRRTFIDLPVIIGSGAIAFLNAGSSTLFADPQMSSIALGVGSLVLGVLNSVGTYYGWSKRAEGHRIAAIQYSRLYRFLSIEMSLPREERMTPSDLLKYTKDTYDRLQEISPLIPPTVNREFHRRFDKEKEIAKPEELNGLEKIEVYRELRHQLSIRVPPSSDGSEDGLLQSPAVAAPRPLAHLTAQIPSLAQRTRPSQRTEAGGSVPALAVGASAQPSTSATRRTSGASAPSLPPLPEPASDA